jgi:hypothetical protein
MKVFGVLVLVLILSLLSTVRAEQAADGNCPITTDGETALDCPWAGLARAVSAETDPAAIEAILKNVAPDFLRRLSREGRIAGDTKKLWGRSINFDENVKGIIIQPALIDLVLAKARVMKRDDRIVFAGFEHTYGYLLSILKTPYGFKRLRWVRPDIENGFGLEKGAISPTPRDGGLFMDLSYFAGQIAFRADNTGDKAALKVLRKANGVARSLRRYDYSTLHGRRLTETLTLGGGRTVEIRTDFVPFTVKSAETGGNSELLVYSIRDSAEKLPYLISAFPISPGFSDGALNPANLGEGKPVVTKYNAFVSGITDVKSPFTGKREASTF